MLIDTIYLCSLSLHNNKRYLYEKKNIIIMVVLRLMSSYRHTLRGCKKKDYMGTIKWWYDDQQKLIVRGFYSPKNNDG